MKKILFLACLCVIQASTLFAQVPNAFSYQGVARDIAGLPLATTTISIRASILNTSATGTAVYEETHHATTNAFGLFTLNIGGGTPSTGTFAAIDWAVNTKFLKIEMDVLNGSNYTLAGTTQILSVAYAQYAKNSTPQSLSISGNSVSISGGNTITLPTTPGGKTFVTLSGAITNAEAITKLAAEAGVNTQVISIVNCTNLTTVDLSPYTGLFSLAITGNTALTSVNLTGLKEVANTISIVNNTALSSVNLPAITMIGDGLNVTGNIALNSLNAPLLKLAGWLNFYDNNSLTTVGLASLEMADVDIENSPVLSALTLTKLVKGNLLLEELPALTSISLSVWSGGQLNLSRTGLTTVALPAAVASAIRISDNDQLTSFTANVLVRGEISIISTKITSLNFPAFITMVGGINIVGGNLLTNVSFPVLVNYTSGNINYVTIRGGIPSANVNTLLAKLVGLGTSLTGQYINLNQTPAAAPTGQGVTDKATLTSRGNTVYTD